MTDLTAPLPPPPKRGTAPALLTTRQAADQLGITPGALRVRHHRGTAPPSRPTPEGRMWPADTLHTKATP